MGLNIKTDKETEKKELTISQIENLIFLTYRSDYRSYFHFAYNDKTEKERFVGYAGSTCTIYEEDDDTFDQPFPKDVDIYICPNGMKSPYKRTSENLVNIQNIIIDIDSHNSNLTIEELNKHILEFQKKLIDKLLIKPNFINRTGRGIHLWFCIEPCYVALDKICLAVIDMICNHIKEIMKELGEKELSIDKSSSLKLNGLFRLPYTYNTKANKWAEGELLHKETPNINTLYKKLKKSGYKSRYFSNEKKSNQEKKKNKKQYKFSGKIKYNDYTPCLIHRKKFMDYLFKTRDIEIGSRDIMIFAMYSTVIMLLEREEAEEYCIELNESFKEPLKYSELYTIFKEINKKQHRFTVEKLFDFVNATEEEKEWFYKSTIKEEKKAEKRKEKIERNIKVKELYEKGISIVQISKEMKISRPTIYKILEK